jgi:hypothetical protein
LALFTGEGCPAFLPSPPPSPPSHTWVASLYTNCWPASDADSCPVSSGNGAQCHPCCRRDVSTFPGTLDDCKALCIATTGCDGITHQSDTLACFLRHETVLSACVHNYAPWNSYKLQ